VVIEIPSHRVLPDGHHDGLGSLLAAHDHLVVVVDHLDQIRHVEYVVDHLADDHCHDDQNRFDSQIVDLSNENHCDCLDLLVALYENAVDGRQIDLSNRIVQSHDRLFEIRYGVVQIYACRCAVQSSSSNEVFACEFVQLTILQFAS